MCSRYKNRRKHRFGRIERKDQILRSWKYSTVCPWWRGKATGTPTCVPIQLCPIICWKSESSIYSATPSSIFQNADCQGACCSLMSD
ncbi:hypothetical protein quinque_013346 [Culex quinquefasciatus]